MKPVLRTIIDKNGGEETVFSPTPQMIAYAIKKAKNQHLSNREICEICRIEEKTPARWKTKYGSYFTNWLEEALEQEVMDEAEILHAVGMAQATQAGGFSYWRELARTKGVIKEEVREQKITINTDFSFILEATGGDLNRAREQLLQAARGLAHEGGPRMALPLEQRQYPSPGSGTGEMQGESLALADSLGGDGGRAEPGEALSIVSEQDAPPSSD